MDRLGEEINLTLIRRKQHVGARAVTRSPPRHRARMRDRFVEPSQTLGHARPRLGIPRRLLAVQDRAQPTPRGLLVRGRRLTQLALRLREQGIRDRLGRPDRDHRRPVETINVDSAPPARSDRDRAPRRPGFPLCPRPPPPRPPLPPRRPAATIATPTDRAPVFPAPLQWPATASVAVRGDPDRAWPAPARATPLPSPRTSGIPRHGREPPGRRVHRDRPRSTPKGAPRVQVAGHRDAPVMPSADSISRSRARALCSCDFDVPTWQRQDRRDFLVLQPFDVVQDDHGPVADRQLRETPFEPRPQHRVAVGGPRGHDIRRHPAARARVQRFGWRGATRAVRQRGIHRQPVDPGSQRRVPAKPPEPPEDSDERLLRHLLGFTGAGDARRQREHPPLVAVVQRLLAARGATSNRVEQCGLVGDPFITGQRQRADPRYRLRKN